MPLVGFIHLTAAYSNAVLIAVLPHISDFASKLDLPIKQPITESQVLKSRINWIQGTVGGGFFLNSHYQFGFDDGYVNVFHNLTNNPYITDGGPELLRFSGKDNMTTNDAIAFAREIIVKLGYTPKELHANVPPTSLDGSFNLKSGEHISYCDVLWDNENTVSATNAVCLDFQIDMERKQLVGMELVGRMFWHSNPPISVKPELESDFRERTHPRHAGMFVDTNAPTNLNH